MAEQLPNINVSHRSSSQFTISNITWSGPPFKEENLIRVNRVNKDVMLVRFSARTPSSVTIARKDNENTGNNQRDTTTTSSSTTSSSKFSWIFYDNRSTKAVSKIKEFDI